MVRPTWRGGRARLIAHDSKSCIPSGIGGSNPPLSARKQPATSLRELRLVWRLTRESRRILSTRRNLRILWTSDLELPCLPASYRLFLRASCPLSLDTSPSLRG